ARRSSDGRWAALVRDVEWSLIEMPLPRLQVLGTSEDRFIYQVAWVRDGITRGAFADRDGFDNSIRFVGEAARHLVRLSGVLRPLLQREWSAMVARLNQLPESRLESFLFGATRITTRALLEDLRDLQDGRCFYCQGRIGTQAEVDHFIP